MLSGSSKYKFLNDAYKTLPSGNELLEKIKDYLSSTDGYKWIVEKSTDTEMALADMEAYIPVIEYALGIESVEEVDGGEQDTAPLEQIDHPTV